MLPNYYIVNEIILLVIIMTVYQTYKIYELLENINEDEYRKTICKNLRNFRMEHYNQYKKENGNLERSNNPYSTENLSNYLGISKTHYKRLESENDKSKYISLDNLIKLSIIFDKKIDEFLEK